MNREQDYQLENRYTAHYQRILVATDGSECSVRAAAHAVYLAEALEARLYALHSVNVQRAFHMGIHFGEAIAELRRFGQSAIDAVREMAEDRGLECEEILVDGVPHRSIIRVSDEMGADLIVLGSTGMTSLERALIGSESQKVLLHSKCPVLLIHEPEQRLGKWRSFECRDGFGPQERAEAIRACPASHPGPGLPPRAHDGR